MILYDWENNDMLSMNVDTQVNGSDLLVFGDCHWDSHWDSHWPHEEAQKILPHMLLAKFLDSFAVFSICLEITFIILKRP